MPLRLYQQEAVAAVYRHLHDRDDNPIVVLPTGAGKSWVIAQLASDAVTRWKGRVVILAHMRELLEQNAEKILRLCPKVRVGIYSAGLNRRDTDAPVLIAGIQSIYKRAAELDAFDLVIVDECHLISLEGEGMYRQFLAEAKAINPLLRVIGLTATPYRLGSGLICSPDHFLNAICYEAGTKELICNGYLSPLVSKAAATKVDTSGLHVRAGEFVTDEVEHLMDQDSVVEAACREIIELTHDRRSVLIFTSGVAHGRHVQRVLQERHGIECEFVCGETPARQRDEVLARFRGDSSKELFARQPLKYLANANLLTVGFDAPNIDCVALLRPTMSPGFLVQMVGRGLRLHPGKQNCLVLDFAGNLLRHGPIDQVQPRIREANTAGQAPAKECPECRSVIAAGYASCPDCGQAFPPPERPGHTSKASEAGVLSGDVSLTEYRVIDACYTVHTKRDAREGDPQTMRVDYKVGWHEYKSEWVCLEHTGFARQKAVAWWKRRSPDPVPDTAERAVELAQDGALAATLSITVRSVAGEPYERIVEYELGPTPEPLPAEVLEFYEEAPDAVPF